MSKETQACSMKFFRPTCSSYACFASCFLLLFIKEPIKSHSSNFHRIAFNVFTVHLNWLLKNVHEKVLVNIRSFCKINFDNFFIKCFLNSKYRLLCHSNCLDRKVVHILNEICILQKLREKFIKCIKISILNFGHEMEQ